MSEDFSGVNRMSQLDHLVRACEDHRMFAGNAASADRMDAQLRNLALVIFTMSPEDEILFL